MAELLEDEDDHGGYIEVDAIQRRALVEAARDGNADIVEGLLNRKIYPDIVVNQSTALNQAVLNTRIEVVELLLQRKANIDKPDAGGQHPLMKCARSGKDKLCTLLLEAKAETNAVDSYGQTALHKAARHGHDKICSMLIEHKADLNISETVHGHTPVMFAAIKNSQATVKILMDAKADATLHNYVRLLARVILLILAMNVRYILVLCLVSLERVLRAFQEGLTARQVARAKSYHSVEKILPKDPNQKGCILL